MIRRGSKGAAVTSWQEKINAVAGRVGISTIATDGAFGPATERATRAVQKWLGVVPDGIVGPATEASYRAKASPSIMIPPSITQSPKSITQKPSTGTGFFTRTMAKVSRSILRVGSRGTAVTAWQERINAFASKAGISPIATDGAFGPATERATRAIQKYIGVTPDGIVGPATRAAYLAKAGGGPSIITQPGTPGIPSGAPRVPSLPSTTIRTDSVPIMRQGSRGPYVREWQEAINAISAAVPCEQVDEDGVFGPMTRTVSIKVQRYLGVPADGIIGPRTLAAYQAKKYHVAIDDVAPGIDKSFPPVPTPTPKPVPIPSDGGWAPRPASQPLPPIWRKPQPSPPWADTPTPPPAPARRDNTMLIIGGAALVAVAAFAMSKKRR